MRWPKVLVFTPTYAGKDYCLDKFLLNVSKFTYKNYEHIIIDNTEDKLRYFTKLQKKVKPFGIRTYHVKRGNSSREALARAQNKAREIFLEGDYDYLLSLESDIFPGANIIEALLWDNKDIVTGLYLIGTPDRKIRVPCITVKTNNEVTGTVGTRLLKPDELEDYIKKGLKEVAAGGMGCTLISREILEKVGFTYIPGHRAHSDVFFFNEIGKLGYRVFVDTNLYCAHLYSDWDDVKDR